MEDDYYGFKLTWEYVDDNGKSVIVETEKEEKIEEDNITCRYVLWSESLKENHTPGVCHLMSDCDYRNFNPTEDFINSEVIGPYNEMDKFPNNMIAKYRQEVDWYTELACDKVSYDVCQPKVCKCSKGVGAVGEFCYENAEEGCDSCDQGYKLHVSGDLIKKSRCVKGKECKNGFKFYADRDYCFFEKNQVLEDYFETNDTVVDSFCHYLDNIKNEWFCNSDSNFKNSTLLKIVDKKCMHTQTAIKTETPFNFFNQFCINSQKFSEKFEKDAMLNRSSIDLNLNWFICPFKSVKVLIGSKIHMILAEGTGTWNNDTSLKMCGKVRFSKPQSDYFEKELDYDAGDWKRLLNGCKNQNGGKTEVNIKSVVKKSILIDTVKNVDFLVCYLWFIKNNFSGAGLGFDWSIFMDSSNFRIHRMRFQN